MNTQLIESTVSLFSKIDSLAYIRFDLGGDHENGSYERTKQVENRVYQIFEEIFSDDETIIIYFKDWVESYYSFRNTTPNYIYELLEGFLIESIDLKLTDEETGEDYIQKDSYFRAKVKKLNYKHILSGICNYDQGREPRISQEVYFISEDFSKRLYMYDDRGCDVHSTDIESIRGIYDKFNDWILDYNKVEIDTLFRIKKRKNAPSANTVFPT